MSSAGIYHISKWISHVSDGVSDTRRVRLEGFAKVNSVTYPYCVANEFLASKLGVRLGITMPPGTLVKADDLGEPGWATLTFGDALPPIDPRSVVSARPDMSAGVVVFDILIVNTDRHTRNLAYRPSEGRLEVFDHSHALFGPDAASVAERFSRARSHLAVTGAWPRTNRHCLIDHVTSAIALMGWAEKIQRELADEFIIEGCREVAQFGIGPSQAESDEMAMFLRNRRDALKDLIRENRSEFRAIDSEDWGMA